MNSPRSQLLALIEQGVIPEEKMSDALRATRITPDGQSWITFLDRFLLCLGGISIAVAALFFVAFNWSEIGRFSKFALIEGLIVIAIISYCRSGEQTVAGKVSLLAATIFLGVLLALFGQTYQTGADPWQLFSFWALLMLPWAVISRFPALWIVWIALVNVSLFLYYDTFRGTFLMFFDTDRANLWLPFCCNTLALVVWELSARILPWLAQKWASRLIAVSSCAPLTLLVFHTIFSYGEDSIIPGLLWGGWISVMYVVYRRIKPDLFILACCCLSGIILGISFFTKLLFDNLSMESFLFLALLTVGMGGGSAFWLKNVYQEIHG
jgi:uncharacterized membrane protein